MKSVLTVLAVVALSVPAGAGERKAAAEQVRTQGVVAYDVEEASKGAVRVRLVRRGSESAPATELLTLHTIEGGDDTAVKFTPQVGDPVSIDWFISKGRITIRQGDDSVTVFWDDASARWGREGSESLYERTKKDVEMIGTVIVDFTERGLIGRTRRHDPGIRGPRSESETGPAPAPKGSGAGFATDTFVKDETVDDGSTPGSNCTGQEHRGSAFGNTRSYACRAATDHVKSLCSNCSCAACCFYWECDAMCAYGDGIVCSAGRSGKACAVPNSMPCSGGGGW